jgi:hypothetical protein
MGLSKEWLNMMTSTSKALIPVSLAFTLGRQTAAALMIVLDTLAR